MGCYSNGITVRREDIQWPFQKRPVGSLLLKLGEILKPVGPNRVQHLKRYRLDREPLFLLLPVTRTAALPDS